MDSRLTRHPLGFLELSQKPDEESLERYYAEKYYQTEAGNYRQSYSNHELEVIRLRIALRADRARELMNNEVRAGGGVGRLLDVGCGEGFVLAAFAADGWEVSGIDHSLAGVQRMNSQMLEYVEQDNVFAALDRRITSGEKYDLVWLGNVLEHVLDPVALLRSLRKLLTPGGIAVIVVPNDGNEFHEELFSERMISERFWISIPDHISYFTADSLRQTAAATGWAVRDLQGDFPVDFFLAHEGSNYVADREKGPSAHAARLRLERLIGRQGVTAANRFYSALGNVGFGRNIVAYLAPDVEGDGDE